MYREAEIRHYVLFGIENGRLVEVFTLLIHSLMYYTGELYIGGEYILIGDFVEHYYYYRGPHPIFGGLHPYNSRLVNSKPWSANNGVRISRETFDEIRQKFGLDNVMWRNIPDERDVILNMIID